MPSTIAAVSLLVDDYEPAIRFFTQALVDGQGAGRGWLFLQTDDFDGELAHFRAHGVRLAEAPRREAYGQVVVFLRLHGNRWDLIEPIEAGP